MYQSERGQMERDSRRMRKEPPAWAEIKDGLRGGREPVVRCGLRCSRAPSKELPAGMVLSSGLPAKACSRHFLIKGSSDLRAILLSKCFCGESLPPFLAEVKWNQGQQGHTEVIPWSLTSSAFGGS